MCIQVSVGRGSTRVYPYEMRKKLRTHSKNKKYAEDATKEKTVNLNLYDSHAIL